MNKTAAMTMEHAVMARPVSGSGNILTGPPAINGCGGYTGEEANLLYTVVTFGKLNRLKFLVKKTDPNTFLVVSDTVEVMGAWYWQSAPLVIDDKAPSLTHNYYLKHLPHMR